MIRLPPPRPKAAMEEALPEPPATAAGTTTRTPTAASAPGPKCRRGVYYAEKDPYGPAERRVTPSTSSNSSSSARPWGDNAVDNSHAYIGGEASPDNGLSPEEEELPRARWIDKFTDAGHQGPGLTAQTYKPPDRVLARTARMRRRITNNYLAYHTFTPKPFGQNGRILSPSRSAAAEIGT